jgi:hypothetical protein
MAREQQAKGPDEQAAQASAKANAESQQASKVASAALEALRAAAASQPKTENLLVVTSADIAAYAEVFGESDAAKRLFCRGSYTVGAMEPQGEAPDTTMALSVPQVGRATTALKTSAPTEPAAVPLPVARPPARPR